MLLHSLRPIALVTCLLICPIRSVAGISAPTQLLTSAKNIIVWQRFDTWLMITEDQTAGRVCYYYDPAHNTKLNLKTALPGTWTPLGSAIKWLMYVDYYQGLNRLMAHDVDFHMYHIAWPSSQNQVGCGMSGTACVFGQYRASMVGDHYPVDLYNYSVQSGAYDLICASDSEKSQFAHDGDLIVYRAYNGPGNVSVKGIYFSGGGEFEIAARDAIEPSVCGVLVAWAEASGTGFNIVAKNLDTGEIRTVAYTTANPPRPEAGRGAIFWQSVGATSGLDIRGYEWATGQEFTVTNATGDQIRLRVCDDRVTWVTGPTNYQTLWSATYQPPVAITDLRAALVTESATQLAWTSPGTTGNPAVSYELRTRTDSPVTDANWATSSVVGGLPSPKSPGQSEEFTLGSLALGRHYFALKAQLSNGEYTLLSNCICSYNSTPANAFAADLGACISFTGVVVGTGSDGAVYLQGLAGVRGVRVVARPGQAAVSQGQVVTATGELGQASGLIGPALGDAVIATQEGTRRPRFYAMSARSLGGNDSRFGGTAEGGATNAWMPVRICGVVSDLSSTGGCSFCVDDGSRLPDNAGHGVLVSSPFAAPQGLANGRYVVVEGVVCLSGSSGRRVDVLSVGGVRVIR